jgi:hypothetical protein
VPLVVAVAAALGSCGGGDSDSGPFAGDETSPSSSTQSASPSPSEEVVHQVSACELLSPDEVAAAVGTPVKDGIPNAGEPITGGTYTSCLWMSDDPANPADQAQLYLYSNTAAADSAREDDSEDVRGIGDSAFTVSFAGVWVYQGEQSFLAQWYSFSGNDDDNLPKSKALAKAAADKLQAEFT